MGQLALSISKPNATHGCLSSTARHGHKRKGYTSPPSPTVRLPLPVNPLAIYLLEGVIDYGECDEIIGPGAKILAVRTRDGRIIQTITGADYPEEIAQVLAVLSDVASVG